MKKRRTLSTGICVYCGRTGRLTKDHVPPKNLFRGSSVQLITVPSCEACNKGASKDDEYFRLVLAIRSDVGDHPQVKELLSAIYRSLERPDKVGFARAFGRSFGPVELRSAGGLYLGREPGYKVDLGPRLDRVAQRVVKGLFFHEFGRRLPNSHSCGAFAESGFGKVDSGTQLNLRKHCEILYSKPPTQIGDGVFSYWFQAAADEPDSTIWLLQFFERVRFLALTGPKEKFALANSGRMS